ncbi:hypothetical protein Fmac_006462 [Flemingia macrophylla]|uniref:Uncharacterized protein n=1 Tax=Flemingia macrophylla TaxID=520843 RepID=A0ABD1NAN7_9FABA
MAISSSTLPDLCTNISKAVKYMILKSFSSQIQLKTKICKKNSPIQMGSYNIIVMGILFHLIC